MKSLIVTRFKRAVVLSILTSLSFFSSGTAMSAAIQFGEDGDSTFALTSGFDAIAATIIHTNIFGGEDDIRVTGSFFTNTPVGLTGDSLVVMLEPGCVGNICASDYIHVQWVTRADPVAGAVLTVADLIAEFGSDPEFLGGSDCAANHCIIENGQIQDITALLSLPVNMTVSAQSDLEVPEPATLALLGLGLVGVGFSRRKQ